MYLIKFLLFSHVNIAPVQIFFRQMHGVFLYIFDFSFSFNASWRLIYVFP